MNFVPSVFASEIHAERQKSGPHCDFRWIPRHREADSQLIAAIWKRWEGQNTYGPDTSEGFATVGRQLILPKLRRNVGCLEILAE